VAIAHRVERLRGGPRRRLAAAGVAQAGERRAGVRAAQAARRRGAYEVADATVRRLLRLCPHAEQGYASVSCVSDGTYRHAARRKLCSGPS